MFLEAIKWVPAGDWLFYPPPVKLNPRQGHYLFVVLMCICMSGAISLAMLFLRVGFDLSLGGFINQWLKNWVIAFCVAVPVALVVVPTVRKIVAALSK